MKQFLEFSCIICSVKIIGSYAVWSVWNNFFNNVCLKSLSHVEEMLGPVFVIASSLAKWQRRNWAKLPMATFKGNEFLFTVHNKILIKSIFFDINKTGWCNNFCRKKLTFGFRSLHFYWRHLYFFICYWLSCCPVVDCPVTDYIILLRFSRLQKYLKYYKTQ